jgi:DNA-binding transcriptional regulator YiaG
MMAAPKLVFSTSAEIKAFRHKHGMNQSAFWGRVGVTQSGGSRYESERNIPRPVQLLLHIAYAPDARSHRLVDDLRKWKTEPTSSA